MNHRAARAPWSDLSPPHTASWPPVIDLRSELCEKSAQLTRLRHPLPARQVLLAPGTVPFDLIDLDGDSSALMLLDGLLLGELDAGRSHTAWLLGTHDLIRPSAMHELVLTESVRWRALAPTRAAVLDREFGVRAGGIPIVARVLLARATRTSNWLMATSLILTSPVVEERLLLLFALLGERWGKVTSEGIVLRLPLTHAMLAALCGARRPSVTIALHALERDGLLSCIAKGRWLLHRHPSGEENGSRRSACLPHYERSLGLG